MTFLKFVFPSRWLFASVLAGVFGAIDHGMGVGIIMFGICFSVTTFF